MAAMKAPCSLRQGQAVRDARRLSANLDLAARVAFSALRREGKLWASSETQINLAKRNGNGLVKHIREVFDLPQTCEARQLARLLHRFARARIGGILVDCDRSWPHSMRLFQCLAKEAPRSGRAAQRPHRACRSEGNRSSALCCQRHDKDMSTDLSL